MKSINILWGWFFTMILLLSVSCEDLDELNINPNGVAPETADLNLLLPTVITSLGQNIVGLGFGDIAGVMQHTQKDGWTGGHNRYDWDDQGHNWSGWYGIVRNNEEFYQKAVDGDFEFHQGAGLVLRAYTFGMITDLWGPAPFEEALKAEESSEYFKPKYSNQKEIYESILKDLEEANTLLSKSPGEYQNIDTKQDVLFNGDPAKWRKLANSLALRYYMRLSEKEPDFAKNGIQRIASDSDKYPLILSASEDATVSYIGSSPSDSWPTTTEFENDPSGNYMRIKMAATFVEKLQELQDPRLGVWANKVSIPLKIVDGTGVDRIVDGVREVSQDIVDEFEEANKESNIKVNTDPEYVGLPTAVSAAQVYNLTPDIGQGTFNPHVSHLADMYKQSTGSMLLMRLMAASEVHLILAEAAMKGWISSSPESYYESGIRESFKTWGVEGDFDGYLEHAPYDGLESIITQKWIASWSAATEAWFDYRRTGIPDLKAGPNAKRQALPLRFYYNFDNEISRNRTNAEHAIQEWLEPTSFVGSDPNNNSAWSKIWLLQGTGKPY